MTATIPTPPFGEWLATAGNVAHYRLAGAFLCGSAAAVVAGPLRGDANSGRGRIAVGTGGIIVPHCRACSALNWRRWAGLMAGAK